MNPVNESLPVPAHAPTHAPSGPHDVTVAAPATAVADVAAPAAPDNSVHCDGVRVRHDGADRDAVAGVTFSVPAGG